MTKGTAGPLLTDLQLIQWRSEINDLYAEADRIRSHAAKRENRLKRYIARHFGLSYSTTKQEDKNGK